MKGGKTTMGNHGIWKFVGGGGCTELQKGWGWGRGRAEELDY